MRATDVISRPLQATRQRRDPAAFIPRLVSDMRTSAINPSPTSVSVATDATAHTKGSWVEVIAATTADADIIALMVTGTALSGSGNQALMDVGIGAAGAEVIIAPNVGVGNRNSAGPAIALPVSVPEGSRLAVRWQSMRSSATAATVSMALFSWPKASGLRSPTELDNIGANTSTTAGVSAGSTSNVWTQMTSSAAQAYQGFVVCPGSSDATMSSGVTAIDVGVGASGAEVGVDIGRLWTTNTSEYYMAESTAERSPGLVAAFVPLHCPAGARIAARVRDSAQSSNTPEVILMGVPYA